METRLRSSSRSSGIVVYIWMKLLKQYGPNGPHRKFRSIAGLICRLRRQPNTCVSVIGKTWKTCTLGGGVAPPWGGEQDYWPPGLGLHPPPSTCHLPCSHAPMLPWCHAPIFLFAQFYIRNTMHILGRVSLYRVLNKGHSCVLHSKLCHNPITSLLGCVLSTYHRKYILSRPQRQGKYV